MLCHPHLQILFSAGTFTKSQHVPYASKSWKLTKNMYLQLLTILNELPQLQLTHLDVYEEFPKNFRLQKSNCKFSKITADQNYDEKNAKIKGIGGATGLIKNEMICGSEISLSY